jgi:serine/threonine protein kinase
MVSAEDRIKVLDFGLARLLRTEETHDLQTEATTEVLTDQQKRIGTLPYMSPEQIRGEPADHRSDIFAIGVILYQMASGRHPFQKSSPADLASAILRDKPTRIFATKSKT